MRIITQLIGGDTLAPKNAALLSQPLTVGTQTLTLTVVTACGGN